MSASAELRGLRGDHRIELVSGGLSFQNLSGDLKIHTVSGDIRGQELSGGINISSVSGDIKLLELHSDSVKLHTVSGDMLIDTETILDGCSIETVSGNVLLDLLPEAAFTVQMTSFSGDIRSELPTSHNPNQMGHRVCEIQGGGPILQIQSLSGDLIIRNKIGETPAAAEDPPPPVDSMDILEQVASGELSVDRAIEALQD
jgi:hypothetical protein